VIHGRALLLPRAEFGGRRADLGGQDSPDELDSWRGFRAPLQRPGTPSQLVARVARVSREQGRRQRHLQG
jgi:hypothetical protein